MHIVIKNTFIAMTFKKISRL